MERRPCTLPVLTFLAAVTCGTAAGQTPPGAAPQQDSEAPKRLGRKYPVPMPPPTQRQGEQPRAHVSVVSPRESGVHQKIGRQRQRGRAAGDLGGAPVAAPPGRRPSLDESDDERDE
jgi:hypothetical protein